MKWTENHHKYKYMNLMYINHNVYLDSFKKKHKGYICIYIYILFKTGLHRSIIRVLPETLFYSIILIGKRAQFYNPLECHFYGNIFFPMSSGKEKKTFPKCLHWKHF